MKKIFLLISILSLLLSISLSIILYLFPACLTMSSQNPIIIVDAGHGGEDGGAVAADNTCEKDYNLEIALKLYNSLTLSGYNVVMTRTTDTMTCDDGLNTIRSKKVSDIRNRLALTEKYPNCILVSIHQNKFSDSRQNGTQVFYSGNNAESSVLAEDLQNEIISYNQKDNKRKIKKCGTEIFLLYHAKCPAVLIECGFISNYNDLSKLKTDDYKSQLAILITSGIQKYFLMGD